MSPFESSPTYTCHALHLYLGNPEENQKGKRQPLSDKSQTNVDVVRILWQEEIPQDELNCKYNSQTYCIGPFLGKSRVNILSILV